MRSSFDIIAEILRISKNGAKKTRIMYTCGLSYNFVQKYLDMLLQTDLLKLGSAYYTTEKGMGFLRNYQNLDLLINATC
jgi:predicted transcriptional regulator